MLPHSKAIELGSSDQEASSEADRIIEIVLGLRCAWTCVAAANSGYGDIAEIHGCHLLRLMSSQWGSQKLLQN